jgi:REP-associated tyrosine transposase
MPLARLTDPIGRVRLGRYSSPGEVVLAELRAYGARKPFVDLATGQAVAQALQHTQNLGYGRTLAWTLLPNRLLWLTQLLPDGGSLARLVGSLKGRSTWLITRQRAGLDGRIWASGYEDRLIGTLDSLVATLREVVAAPVTEGLVKRSADYPYWDAIWLDQAATGLNSCRGDELRAAGSHPAGSTHPRPIADPRRRC